MGSAIDDFRDKHRKYVYPIEYIFWCVFRLVIYILLIGLYVDEGFSWFRDSFKNCLGGREFYDKYSFIIAITLLAVGFLSNEFVTSGTINIIIATIFYAVFHNNIISILLIASGFLWFLANRDFYRIELYNEYGYDDSHAIMHWIKTISYSFVVTTIFIDKFNYLEKYNDVLFATEGSIWDTFIKPIIIMLVPYIVCEIILSLQRIIHARLYGDIFTNYYSPILRMLLFLPKSVIKFNAILRILSLIAVIILIGKDFSEFPIGFVILAIVVCAVLIIRAKKMIGDNINTYFYLCPIGKASDDPGMYLQNCLGFDKLRGGELIPPKRGLFEFKPK